MALKDFFLPEFDHETGTTRRLLERVPDGKLTWKPHEKSMTLGRLARHIAELTGYGVMAIKETEMNFDPASYHPREPESRAEVLALFEENVAATRKLVEHVTDGELMVNWTLKMSGQAVLSMPRGAVLRTLLMNHMIHHRGQLSVYLRENDVPLPSIYGPTADEK